MNSIQDLIYLENNKILGEGAFSKVLKVKSKLNNKIYALKTCQLNNLSNQDKRNLEQEIILHKNLNHENIIKFTNHFRQNNTLYLLLEYAGNGSLFFFIHSGEGIQLNLALRFFYQTVKAVKYLHDKNLIHRDIKPENILLDEDFNVKLCDFGWSCFLKDQDYRTSICGTYEYMSPEIAFDKTHTNKVDIWCLGVLLYEMIHGMPPFSAQSLNDIKDEFLRKDITMNQNIDPLLQDLLKKMLDTNDQTRITIDQVLQHQIIQKNIQEFQEPIKQEEFGVLLRNYFLNTQGQFQKSTPELVKNYVYETNPMQRFPQQQKIVEIQPIQIFQKKNQPQQEFIQEKQILKKDQNTQVHSKNQCIWSKLKNVRKQEQINGQENYNVIQKKLIIKEPPKFVLNELKNFNTQQSQKNLNSNLKNIKKNLKKNETQPTLFQSEIKLNTLHNYQPLTQSQRFKTKNIQSDRNIQTNKKRYNLNTDLSGLIKNAYIPPQINSERIIRKSLNNKKMNFINMDKNFSKTNLDNQIIKRRYTERPIKKFFLQLIQFTIQCQIIQLKK